MTTPTFQDLFREHRTRMSLTQRAVANALSVSQTAVYLWESGRAIPTLGNLVALERLFAVDPGTLLIPCAYALSPDQGDAG